MGETERSGSLVVVGTGIQVVRQVTLDALDRIRRAEHLLYLVATGVMERWILMENPRAETLEGCQVPGRPRLEAYEEMVARILAPVRAGHDVCAVFYGHPGVFVHASHEAMRQARAEGFRAQMLPAVSAADCLYADLGLDPGRCGCMSFEATDFLASGRPMDPRSLLVLWQVGVIGTVDVSDRPDSGLGLQALRDVLGRVYDADHEVVVYEASQHPGAPPRMDRVPLRLLAGVEVSAVSTLVVPPVAGG